MSSLACAPSYTVTARIDDPPLLFSPALGPSREDSGWSDRFTGGIENREQASISCASRSKADDRPDGAHNHSLIETLEALPFRRERRSFTADDQGEAAP